MNKKGCLVISLDFELMWGCKDWATIGGYGTSNIKNEASGMTRTISFSMNSNQEKVKKKKDPIKCMQHLPQLV